MGNPSPAELEKLKAEMFRASEEAMRLDTEIRKLHADAQQTTFDAIAAFRAAADASPFAGDAAGKALIEMLKAEAGPSGLSPDRSLHGVVQAAAAGNVLDWRNAQRQWLKVHTRIEQVDANRSAGLRTASSAIKKTLKAGDRMVIDWEERRRNAQRAYLDANKKYREAVGQLKLQGMAANVALANAGSGGRRDRAVGLARVMTADDYQKWFAPKLAGMKPHDASTWPVIGKPSPNYTFYGFSKDMPEGGSAQQVIERLSIQYGGYYRKHLAAVHFKVSGDFHKAKDVRPPPDSAAGWFDYLKSWNADWNHRLGQETTKGGSRERIAKAPNPLEVQVTKAALHPWAKSSNSVGPLDKQNDLLDPKKSPLMQPLLLSTKPGSLKGLVDDEDLKRIRALHKEARKDPSKFPTLEKLIEKKKAELLKMGAGATGVGAFDPAVRAKYTLGELVALQNEVRQAKTEAERALAKEKLRKLERDRQLSRPKGAGPYQVQVQPGTMHWETPQAPGRPRGSADSNVYFTGPNTALGSRKARTARERLPGDVALDMAVRPTATQAIAGGGTAGQLYVNAGLRAGTKMAPRTGQPQAGQASARMFRDLMETAMPGIGGKIAGAAAGPIAGQVKHLYYRVGIEPFLKDAKTDVLAQRIQRRLQTSTGALDPIVSTGKVFAAHADRRKSHILDNSKKAKGFYKKFMAGVNKLAPAVKKAELSAGKDAVGAALAALDAALAKAQGATVEDAAVYAMEVGARLGSLAKASKNAQIVKLQQALQDRMAQISAAAAGVPLEALQKPIAWDTALAAFQGEKALEKLAKESPAMARLLGDRNKKAALDRLANSVPGGLSTILQGKAAVGALSGGKSGGLGGLLQGLAGADTATGVLGGKKPGQIFKPAKKAYAKALKKYNTLAEALSMKRPSWATPTGKAAVLHVIAGLIDKGQELRLQHALPHLLPGGANRILQALGVFMGQPVHKGLWSRIKSAASSAVSAVKSVARSAVSTVASVAKTVAAPALKIAKAVGHGVSNAAKSLSSAVSEKASQIASAAAKVGKKALSLGKAAVKAYANGVSTVANAVKSVASAGWQKAKSVASSAISTVASTVKKGANAVAQVAGSAWQKAKSGLAMVGAKVKGGLAAAWDKAKVVGGAIGKAAWKAFQYTPLGLAVKYAGPLVKAGMAKIGPTLNKWKTGLAEFGKKAWSGIKTVGKGISNFVQSPIGQLVVTGLSIAANFIPGGPLIKGAIGFAVGTISALASGKDWKQALLAGGLGALEAVIPVAKLGLGMKAVLHAGKGALQAAAEGGDWKDIVKGAGMGALQGVGGDLLKKFGGGKGIKMLEKFAKGKIPATGALGKVQKMLMSPGGQKLVGGITKVGKKTVNIALKAYDITGKTHGVLEKVTRYGGVAKNALELVNDLAEAGAEKFGDNSLLGKALGKVAGWSGAGKDLLDKGLDKAEWLDDKVMTANKYLGAGLKFVGVNPEKALAKMEKERKRSGKKSAMEELRERIAGSSTVQKLSKLQQKIVDSKLSKTLQKGYKKGLQYAVRIEGGLGKLQDKLQWAMEKGEQVDGILAQIDKLAEQGQDLMGEGRVAGGLGKLRGWIGKGREGIAFGMEKAGWLDEKAGTVKGYLGRGLDLVGADREQILAEFEKEKKRRTKKNALEKLADKLKAKVNVTRGKLADVAKRFAESKLGKALAKGGKFAIAAGAWTHDKLGRLQEVLAWGIAGGEKIEKTLAQIAGMAREGSELLGDSKWAEVLARVGMKAEEWQSLVGGGLEKVRKVNEMAGTAGGALEQIYAMGGRDLAGEYSERRERLREIEEKERSTWRHRLSDRVQGMLERLQQSGPAQRAKGALDKLGKWRDAALAKGAKALDKVRAWRDKIAGGGVWVHGKLAKVEKYLGKGIKFGKKVDSVLESVQEAAEAGAERFEGSWLGGALAKLASWAGKGDEMLDKGIAGAKKVKGGVGTAKGWLEKALGFLGVDLGEKKKKGKKRPLEEMAEPAEDREFAEVAEGGEPASDDKRLDQGGPLVVGGPRRGRPRVTPDGGSMYDPDELALLGEMEEAGRRDAEGRVGRDVGVATPGALDVGLPELPGKGAEGPVGEMPPPLRNASLAIDGFEASVASALIQAQKAMQDGQADSAQGLLKWLASQQKDITMLLAEAEPLAKGYPNGAAWMTHLRQRFARARLRALTFTMAAEGVGEGLYDEGGEAMKDPRVQDLAGKLAEIEAKVQVFVTGGAEAGGDEEKAAFTANEASLRGRLEELLADANPAVQKWAAGALRRLGSLAAVFSDLTGGEKRGDKAEDGKSPGKGKDEEEKADEQEAAEGEEGEGKPGEGAAGEASLPPKETKGKDVLEEAAFAQEPGGIEDTWIGSGEAAMPIGELLAEWARRKMRTEAGGPEGTGDGPKVADEPEVVVGGEELSPETPAAPPKKTRKKKVTKPEKKSWFGELLEKAGDFVSGIAAKVKEKASWFQKLMKKVSGVAGKVQSFTMKWAKKGGMFSGILKKVSAGAGWVKNFTGKLASGAGKVKGIAGTAEKIANKVEKFGKSVSKKGLFGAIGALFKKSRTGSLGSGAPERVAVSAAEQPQRLDAAVLHRMERFLGGKFGDVRIHTGASAGKITQRYEAEAVTIKEHIFFAPGRFNPHTQEGQRLLAHELTHVMQRGRQNLSTREAEGEAMHSEMSYHGDMHHLENKPLHQDWVMAPEAQSQVLTARKDRKKGGAGGADGAEAEGEDLLDMLGERVYDILLEDLENEIESR